jgi:hypothetical protein
MNKENTEFNLLKLVYTKILKINKLLKFTIFKRRFNYIYLDKLKSPYLKKS